MEVFAAKYDHFYPPDSNKLPSNKNIYIVTNILLVLKPSSLQQKLPKPVKNISNALFTLLIITRLKHYFTTNQKQRTFFTWTFFTCPLSIYVLMS